MKDQFVTYEIALKLKELDFNEECFGWYNYDKLQLFGHDCLLDGYAGEEDRPFAPTWQQAIDWFRVKYNIHIKISFVGKYWYEYKKGYGAIYINDKTHIKDSYEEAREASILKVINIIEDEVRSNLGEVPANS